MKTFRAFGPTMGRGKLSREFIISINFFESLPRPIVGPNALNVFIIIFCGYYII